MLSYPIPEAEELLSNKLSAAQQSLSNCEEDLDFLREQVTVSAIHQTFDVPHQHPTNLTTTTTAVILIYERPLTSLPFRQWKSPQREFTTGTFPRSAKRRRKQEEAAKKFPFFQPSDARRSKSNKIERNVHEHRNKIPYRQLRTTNQMAKLHIDLLSNRGYPTPAKLARKSDARVSVVRSKERSPLCHASPMRQICSHSTQHEAYQNSVAKQASSEFCSEAHKLRPTPAPACKTI
jgi:hypothetical protein